MNYPILQIIDPETEALILDLNGYEFDNAGRGFAMVGDEFELGDLDADIEWMETDEDDEALEVVYRRVEMTVPLLAHSPTGYDDLADLVGELGVQLQKGGRMLYQATAASEVRYIDFYPSPIPGLVRGEEDNFLKIANQFVDDGYVVSIWRRPFLEGPKVEGVPLNITNAIDGRDQIVTNPGTAPSLAIVKVTPSGGEIVQLEVGRKSSGTLSDLAEVYGTSIAETTTFAVESWKERWRKVVTAPDVSGLAGRYRAVAIVQVSAAGEYDVQLRYAQGNQATTDVALERIRIDADDLETFHYIPVDLGEVTARARKLTLEGWARREPGGGNLEWHSIILVPAQEQRLQFVLPGMRRGGSGTTFEGRELTPTSGAPTNRENDKLLTVVGQTVVLPAHPEVLEAGRYKVSAEVSLRNKDYENQPKVRFGYLEVRKAGVTIEKQALKTRARLITRRRKTLVFDADGVSTYEVRVRMDQKPAGTDGRIALHKVVVAFHRFAGPADTIVLDGRAKRAYVTTADGETTKVGAARGFLRLAPGPNLLIWELGDLPASGYDDVVEREPLPKIVVGRQASVQVDIIPRYVV